MAGWLMENHPPGAPNICKMFIIDKHCHQNRTEWELIEAQKLCPPEAMVKELFVRSAM
jgi:hypothetical protein